MNKVILGIKKGMTQIFDETGTVVPVTIIDMNEVYLVESTDVDQQFIVKIGVGNKKRPNKAEKEKYSKVGKVPSRVIEFRLSGKDKFEGLKEGDEIKPSVFEVGDYTQITSKTKGKGFQGGVKRWGFHGGPRTHGQSDRERAPGAIGGGTTPGRVYKGKKMAGHMGTRVKTIMNLKVVAADDDNKLLLVKGAVPGPKGSVVIVKKTSLATRFKQ